MTRAKLAFLLLVLAAACSRRQGYFTESERQQVLKSQADMQVLFHSLREGSTVSEKDVPAFLKGKVAEMHRRKAWRDPDEGMLTEARLWQSPASLFYEFFVLASATFPENGKDAYGAEPAALAPAFGDNSYRFEMSVDRLRRARLHRSFDGLAKPIIESLEAAAAAMNDASWAMVEARGGPLDDAGADRYRRAVLTASRTAAAMLETLKTGKAAAGLAVKEPVAALRIAPGYRALELPASEAELRGIHAGDRVDLLSDFEAIMADGGKRPVTATIIQDLPVLETSAGYLLLQMNPAEAQYAQLATQQGAVAFSKRELGTRGLTAIEMMTEKKLRDFVRMQKGQDPEAGRRILPVAADDPSSLKAGALAALSVKMKGDRTVAIARGAKVTDRWEDAKGNEFLYLSLTPIEVQAVAWAAARQLPIQAVPAN